MCRFSPILLCVLVELPVIPYAFVRIYRVDARERKREKECEREKLRERERERERERRR